MRLLETKLDNRNLLINSIVLLILFLVFFFRCTLIPYNLWNEDYRFLIVEFALMLGLYNYKTKSHIMFKKLLVLYGLFIIINCFTCLYFRGQSLWVSVLAWRTFFLIYFYPVFKSWNLSIDIWEKVLYRLFIIILISYILQNMFPDMIFFDLFKDRKTLALAMRIRIYSSGILYLGTLYCWNKYLMTNDKFKLLLYVLGFFMIFLQGFRNLIAATLVVSVIMYLRIFGLSKRSVSISLFILFAGIGSLYLPIVQDKIAEISRRIDRDEKDGGDLIRAWDLNYAYNDHFINNIELICGSGMPILTDRRGFGTVTVKQAPSKYSQMMSNRAAYNYFYTIDLGIVGLSWVAGIPFALVFTFILIKILVTKVGTKYYYLGMYALFLLLSAFTNGVSYHQNNLIWLPLMLIILDCAHHKHKGTQ